jgi:hypothetical protein
MAGGKAAVVARPKMPIDMVWTWFSHKSVPSSAYPFHVVNERRSPIRLPPKSIKQNSFSMLPMV